MIEQTSPVARQPADMLGAQPPVRVEPDARARIRAAHATAGRRIAVLDDDPTGSQTVHDVAVVTALEPEEFAAGLATPGSTCFILTNTRSLPDARAVQLNTTVGRTLLELGAQLNAPIQLVSRSDSTLRGHVIAEMRALDAARRDLTGHSYDGVLLAPAYLEAGRFTAGDVHFARVGDQLLPVGDTEFAQDATFGYTSSNLRDFVAEKSGGTIRAADVHSIGLDDIRLGGPTRVADILTGVRRGGFVVVNATDYADLEVVVLGLLQAEAVGRSFLCRTGPSFVRALAGLEPKDPLTTAELWPTGSPAGHGLVVVGSHVGLTSRQVQIARSRGGLTEVELDVATLLAPARRDAHVDEVTSRVIAALADSEVLLYTSRTVVRGADAAGSLEIAQTVSSAVVEVVRGARTGKPAWVVAKGGITSHDVAVHGLGIRRAEVVGQVLPGLVSVFRPVQAPTEVVGVPYVVFAGNVGDDTTLAYVIDLLRGRA
jgi:uncharacterized protein YgbK (DUF1537 family)